MRTTLRALAGAVGLACAMMALAPQTTSAQGACGGGFCGQERQGCIAICGRCVAQFECSIGSNTCSSDCKCGTPGCAVS
jgi:hypothetical protein